MTPELVSFLDRARGALESFLAPRFADAWPAAFAAPLRYPLMSGGKRIRPALVLAAFEAVGGEPLPAVLPAMAAVELVHTYSLVHDDLPAMDDDDERRGRPTVHVAFDEATAILVGDALLTEAFAVLTEAPVDPRAQVAMIAELARASGYAGMVGGQAGDIGMAGAITNLDDLIRVHRLKTGALITASTVLGGMAAGAQAEVPRLRGIGQAIGLAFQLADDVLDADQDAGDDGPPSYVRLLGIDETVRRARALANEAIAAAAGLAHPSALVALARFSVDRTH